MSTATLPKSRALNCGLPDDSDLGHEIDREATFATVSRRELDQRLDVRGARPARRD